MSQIILKAGPSTSGIFLGNLGAIAFIVVGIYFLQSEEPSYNWLPGVSCIIVGLSFFYYIVFYKLLVTETGIEKHMYFTHTINFTDVHMIELHDKYMLVFAKRKHMQIPMDMDKTEEIIRITLDKTSANPKLKIIATEKVRKKYGLD